MIISLIDQKSAEYILPKYEGFFYKQIIWYVIFFGIVYLISKININKYKRYFRLIYIINIILLILVLFIGKEVNGARAWFDLGFFSLQPSEIMKVSLILILSSIKHNSKHYYFKIIILTIIPSIFTYLEPDTGSIVIYGVILLSYVIMSSNKLKTYVYLSISVIILLSIFTSIYIFNEELFINIFGVSFYYRIERIMSFINQSGLQLENSLIVIATSPLITFNYQKLLLYFPEAPTDFVFTLTINNLGFIGIIILLLLFILLIYELIRKHNKSNRLKKYISFSYIFLMIFQIIYNIYMCIGLLPIIGLTLPFISYGGSNLITNAVLLGIIYSKDNRVDNYNMDSN